LDSGDEHDGGGVSALASMFFGAGELQEIIAAHPTVPEALSIFNPVHTAAIFGGLLTVPALQCNCCRLEALSHLAVAFGQGTAKPSKSAVSSWFSELTSGPCGRNEDPAEDAFTSLVTTPRGNFRILEGIWESAGFCLQRIVNVVEEMPGEGLFLEVKESVHSLLALSDLICQRAQLRRYQFGGESPERHLPRDIAAALPSIRKRVTFSDAELHSHHISLDALAPFIFDPRLRPSLSSASLSHSPLLHHPLLRNNQQIVAALPTAISVAIRSLVVGSLHREGMVDRLVKALAQEYMRFFAHDPPLGTARGAPLFFRPKGVGPMASYATKVDTGRYLQVILTLDALQGFEDTGFAGANPESVALAGDIESEIEECHRALRDGREMVHEVLTLVVGCGIGRAQVTPLSNVQRPGWRIACVSAADVATLGLLPGTTALTLWRILDAKSQLARQSVELFNINGLLNLVAWVRSLDGHLVHHAQVPDGFGRGGRCRVVLDSSFVRSLRIEVADRVDRHAVATIDGSWADVRKANDSLFDEDRSLPLYACNAWDDEHGLPMVFLTKTRHWWCKVTFPRNYQRWKILNTWLPKLATVIDEELTELPLGPLEVRVRFGGFDDGKYREAEATCSKEEIRKRIRVQVDKTQRVISIETDEAFEQGLAVSTNISEVALIEAIVTGLLELANRASGVAAQIAQRIVRDDFARDFHAFQARQFSDFVPASENPVTIDVVDDAALRLGLGWKVRNRDEGCTIEGVGECTAYLNTLVRSIEDDLCTTIQAFDRQALVKVALQNHHAAITNQQTWRKTSAAIVALHDDKQATMRTIADHAFKNNAALNASRVLIEFAVCEAPLQRGRAPGDIDLSRLMAQVLLIQTLGGWSDAMHREAMTPSLRITPLGDIHVDPAFFEEVVMPFGYVTNENMVRSSIEDYASNFEPPVPSVTVEPAFGNEFNAAWQDECGFGIDDIRRVLDEVDDYGIKHNQAIVAMRSTEFFALLRALTPDSDTIAKTLTTMPRPSWRVPPAGFKESDLQPWRLRRRLSLLRRPIVQIDESDDPTVIISPGLLRSAVAYSIHCYHEGSFPQSQLASPAMKAWAGEAANRRGKRFSMDVATRLEELGWRVEKEVSVKRILKRGLERDYGDVDVLAWNESARRVLLVECKDLHFHKTPGELAEQLSDFRGQTRNGKRDLLRKHLDRCAILRQHAEQVSSYAKMSGVPSIEGIVVFRNPVPMLFAWQGLEESVRITTFERLEMDLTCD